MSAVLDWFDIHKTLLSKLPCTEIDNQIAPPSKNFHCVFNSLQFFASRPFELYGKAALSLAL